MIDHPAYPAEPWRVRESAFSPEVLAQSESLFALANGYLGLRGNLDEGEPKGLSGTYLNGFHERRPLHYPEHGYGWAEEGQHLLNVTDGKLVKLRVDGLPLDVRTGDLISHERVLDLRDGTLRRELAWRSPSGRCVQVTSRRLVSLVQPHLAAISYEVSSDEPLRGELISELVGNESNQVNESDPRSSAALHGQVLLPEGATSTRARAVMTHATRRSRLAVAAGMDHVLGGTVGGGVAEPRVERTENLVRVRWALDVPSGQAVSLVKLLAYDWSGEDGPEALSRSVETTLGGAMPGGFDALAAAQRSCLERFWEQADVEIDGDPEVQQAVRFALFHLLQASKFASGQPIPGKGLTGQGYDGHAFWDTEAFVLPVLVHLRPELARSALQWRVSTLDRARAEAARRGLRGAKFAWRTITGDEASAYFPAGEAAVHVDADVAEAVTGYVDATGDDAFLADGGAEILVETARFWVTRGYRDPRRGGAFCIDGVTGPDEYSALVDNNVFTNLMAARNLLAAARSLDELSERDPGAHEELERRLDLSPDEPGAWRRAAEAVFVPFDEALGVHPEDEDFLRHPRWDFQATGPGCYPLMLHFPYASLYRQQVVKQADLVLALHLAGNAFTAEEKRADFDYYEAITVRDSSLSAATQAIVAAEVGYLDRAYAYLREAALMDLEDLEHNSADGLHIAALAGGWLAIAAGLGGLRHDRDLLKLAPRLAGPLRRVSFRLFWRGRRLKVEVTDAEAAYRLLEGESLDLCHWGEPVHVLAGRPVLRPIPPRPCLAEPPSVPGRSPTDQRR